RSGVLPANALAQTPEELEARVRQLEEALGVLKSELATVKEDQARAEAEAAARTRSAKPISYDQYLAQNSANPALRYESGQSAFAEQQPSTSTSTREPASATSTTTSTVDTGAGASR
ncbi:MAG: hypothetical protein HC902_12175, partial [Calothrix sp. SM1_5_4]|nr:hypothetical protein [Calothrix sp. SM1_5_4]